MGAVGLRCEKCGYHIWTNNPGAAEAPEGQGKITPNVQLAGSPYKPLSILR